jgi:iron complex outermembrane recepter protein
MRQARAKTSLLFFAACLTAATVERARGDDARLPVLPISLQVADSPPKKPPTDSKIPEASDEMNLPKIAPPSEVPRGSTPPPEASTLSSGSGESLVSQVAQRTLATSAAKQANPAAPSAVVAPTASTAGTGEVLQQAASVSLRRTSAINLDARIRAFNSAQLNAVAGGINQVKTRVDIDSLFSQIDSGVVSAITVLDGPYSALYGPGFGFLVADLKRPTRFECPQAAGATVFGYESNGSQLMWRDETEFGGPTWGFLSSFGQRVGNDYTPGGETFRIPSSYNQWDGMGAFSLDVAPFRTLDVFYLHNEQNNVELPGVAYDVRQSTNHQFNVRYSAWECDRVERLVLQAWGTQTRYRGDNFASSKQSTWWGHFIGVPFGPYNNEDDGFLSGLLTDGGLDTYGVRGYFKLGDPETWELIAGADWRLERLFYNETDYDPEGNIAFGGNVFGIPRSSTSSVGAFFNLTGKLDPALTVTTGGRVDAWRAGFADDDPVVTVGDPAVFPPSSIVGTNQPDEFLGMGHLTFKRHVSEVVSTSIGAAYAMRPPSLAELYSDQPWVPLVRFGNAYSIGDSNLDPERMLQIDLGARGEWESLTLGIRGFAASVDDYILYRTFAPGDAPNDSFAGNGPAALGRRLGAVDITDDTQGSYQYVNLSRATLLGGDLTAEWRVEPWCTLSGSLAYVRGINEDPVNVQADGTSTSKSSEGLPGIAPLTGVVGVRFFEPETERFGIELAGRLVARQDHLAESLGELSTPGYTVWNVRAWAKVNDNLTISSAVRNIFNADYTQHGSLALANPTTGAFFFVPEPGVSWTTSVEVKY